MRQYTEEYSYDEVGAFLEIVHAANSGNWTRTYSYNEPSLIENAHTSNRLSSSTVGGTTLNYDYDAHGNMISRPHLSAMNWDFKDQLKSVDLGGGGNAYYNYDSKGRRSRKVWEKSPGVTEERLYIGDFEIFRRRNGAGDITFERETLHVREISSDTRGTGKNMMDTEDSDPEEFRGFREKTGQEELSERNGKEKKNENGGSGKTAMFRYRIGAGSVADSALDISEQTAAPHFVMIETRTVGDDGSPLQLISYQYDNHLGSATLELDGSASIISYEEYYPYGMSSYQAVTSQREVCKKRYRFTGKERDEESGLYYFGARYYDADIGLWTSCDPAREFWSPYTYVENDPINSYDPNGEYKVRAVRAGRVWSDQEMALVPNIEYQIVTNTIKNRADRLAGKQTVGRIAKLAGIAGKIVQKVLGFGTKQVFSKPVSALDTKNPIIEHNIDKQLIKSFGDDIGTNVNPKNLTKDELTKIIDASREFEGGENIRATDDIINKAHDKGGIGVK